MTPPVSLSLSFPSVLSALRFLAYALFNPPSAVGTTKVFVVMDSFVFYNVYKAVGLLYTRLSTTGGMLVPASRQTNPQGHTTYWADMFGINTLVQTGGRLKQKYGLVRLYLAGVTTTPERI